MRVRLESCTGSSSVSIHGTRNIPGHQSDGLQIHSRSNREHEHSCVTSTYPGTQLAVPQSSTVTIKARVVLVLTALVAPISFHYQSPTQHLTFLKPLQKLGIILLTSPSGSRSPGTWDVIPFPSTSSAFPSTSSAFPSTSSAFPSTAFHIRQSAQGGQPQQSAASSIQVVESTRYFVFFTPILS